MPINADQLHERFAAEAALEGPKRGDAIFEGTDLPRTWDEFVGQEQAKEQLMVAIASAKARKARMDHTLLSSGIHGIGKTTLGTLVAYTAEVGLLTTTGPLTVEEFRELVNTCEDGDCVFVDEAHLLVTNGRTKSDWLLPWMTSGKLVTRRGAEDTPDVTLIAATTDAGRLPETLLSRFMVQPNIVAYSPAEALMIAAKLAGRMGVRDISPEAAVAIAEASDANPRGMRRILTAVRDLRFVYPDTHPNLERAFEYAGVSEDGLTMVARDILLVLLTSPDLTASLESIAGHLGEPGPLKHHEKQLLQRGLINITGRGRKLTSRGITRAQSELTTRRSA